MLLRGRHRPSTRLTCLVYSWASLVLHRCVHTLHEVRSLLAIPSIDVA
jgi:hypothetical protein